MLREKGVHILFHKPGALIVDNVGIMPDTKGGGRHARLAEILDFLIASDITKSMMTV